MAEHNDFGNQAENAARNYLAQNGYNILARNYRYDRAEIDLICQKGNTTVFVEVKARHSVYYGHPEEAVTPAKERLLLRAADNYIARNKLEGQYRFDIISVIGSGEKLSIKHIEDAFFPTDEE